LKSSSSLNTGVAKNIVLFIGDGMSVQTQTAARILKSQFYRGNFENPESDYLAFERMPHMGHSKTYDTDYQTADSASTASALFSGVKTKYKTIGYDSSIERNDPSSMLTATEVTTVMTWAQEAGMDTGFVTTARVTHATPAALYAHSYTRYYECDRDNESEDEMPPPKGAKRKDIAWQLEQ
jgi:alkaline phosphatase